MGYWMRYVVADDRDLPLTELEAALQAMDPAFRVTVWTGERESGELYLGEELLGELEVNRPGDGLFDEEQEELLAALPGGEGRDRVERLVRSASLILALRVLWQGREGEATLAMIEPMWEALFQLRRGLLLAEGEGWYDRAGLVFPQG